ncbi:vWA-MoxR associated conflict system protein [Streptomyces sp. MN13]
MTEGQHRHLLVVGAQCKEMGTLARLEEAADSLHSVLTDPALGACAARTGDHPSLLVSAALEPEDVRKAIRQAACRARDDNAVLVVALLGHGFTAPQQADLYYMVAKSTTGSPGSAVHVGQVLTEAVDEPGIEGVIALVDTCHAAGAVPDARGIAGGVRAGRTRLSVLTAAAADQAARDMRLTFAVVDVLRKGITGAGPLVYADATLAQELRDRMVGQVVGRFEYDNDPYASDGLWLARNARSAPGAGGGVVGPAGRQDLEEAVALWRAGTRLPARLTRSALNELYTFARDGGAANDADPVWHDRVTDVVATLLGCCELVTLLNTVFTEVLTSDLLGAARRLSALPPEAEGAELLRDLIEYAALRAPKLGESPWKVPARFVAALALLTPGSEVDARLREWAWKAGVVTEFNDALAELARKREQGELRLVVSLAGALTDWPEEVDAWLLGSVEQLPVHERFRCESADQRGVGRAIGTALNWARRRLPVPEQLVNVDVAAPAHLLASWQPEEDRVGLRRLGVNHTVVLRWSGRMDPMEEIAEMNDAARKALRDMSARTGVPVEWIGVSVLEDQRRLEQDLETGRYDTAVGLDHHPEALQDVLEQLLPYAPIILWPRPDAHPGDPRLRDQVERHWQSLPAGFAEAYRNRWSVGHGDCRGCLGEVRTVWHDEPWLEFCRPFEQRVVAGPEEDL